MDLDEKKHATNQALQFASAALEQLKLNCTSPELDAHIAIERAITAHASLKAAVEQLGRFFQCSASIGESNIAPEAAVTHQATNLFEVTPLSDPFLQQIFNEADEQARQFFELLKGQYPHPALFVIKDRNTINLLRGYPTENWLVGWNNGSDAFLLDRHSFAGESCHTYDRRYYGQLMHHELLHVYFLDKARSYHPAWLNEGVALFGSGQNTQTRPPCEFQSFLKYYQDRDAGVYAESGFAVEALVSQFGKPRLLELVAGIREAPDELAFAQLFQRIYGFSLNYKSFNALLSGSH